MSLFYNIHDLVGIGLDEGAAASPQLDHMLEGFRSDALHSLDIVVTEHHRPLENPSHGEHDYRYDDESITFLDTGVQVSLVDGAYRISGTRELLTTLVPVLDWRMTQRQAPMIHAACFEVGGVGIAMPAWGGVGKTSTIAKLVQLPNIGFMGDDWAFMSGAGELLGYPKPMYIKPHHRNLYPHIFEDHKKPIIPKSVARPVGRLTTIVHPYITQYPKLAGFTRRWSPEHITVTPQEAVPGLPLVERTGLGAVVFVERFDGTETVLTETDGLWMSERLVGNFHAELSSPSREMLVGAGAVGIVPVDEMLTMKREVISKAIVDVPLALMKVPAEWSADDASGAIVEHLMGWLDAVGING